MVIKKHSKLIWGQAVSVPRSDIWLNQEYILVLKHSLSQLKILKMNFSLISTKFISSSYASKNNENEILQSTQKKLSY